MSANTNMLNRTAMNATKMLPHHSFKVTFHTSQAAGWEPHSSRWACFVSR